MEKKKRNGQNSDHSLTLVLLLPKEFHFLGLKCHHLTCQMNGLVSTTKFKLVLLTVGQTNKLRYELLWQGTVTLFGKPAD